MNIHSHSDLNYLSDYLFDHLFFNGHFLLGGNLSPGLDASCDLSQIGKFGIFTRMTWRHKSGIKRLVSLSFFITNQPQ